MGSKPGKCEQCSQEYFGGHPPGVGRSAWSNFDQLWPTSGQILQSLANIGLIWANICLKWGSISRILRPAPGNCSNSLQHCSRQQDSSISQLLSPGPSGITTPGARRVNICSAFLHNFQRIELVGVPGNKFWGKWRFRLGRIRPAVENWLRSGQQLGRTVFETSLHSAKLAESWPTSLQHWPHSQTHGRYVARLGQHHRAFDEHAPELAMCAPKDGRTWSSFDDGQN